MIPVRGGPNDTQSKGPRAASGGRVLVVGGGIAGTGLALALHRRGLACSVVERRAGSGAAGLAINLPGNAVAALDRLGLADGLGALGTPVRRREYRTAGGRLLFEIDEDRFWGQQARPRCVRRSDLVALLGRDLPPHRVATGSGVAAVEVDHGEVRIDLDDGSSRTGDLLVGADGVGSVVRRSVDPRAGVGSALLASASWRFMAPNLGVDCWTLWAGDGGLVLLLPVDRDEVYGWVSLARDASSASDFGRLWPTFRHFPEVVRRTLGAVAADPGSAFHSPLDEVRLPSWSRGRVVLIGDAAHATAPVWAQGAALALEDGEVLAGLLATRDDWEAVGRDYEALRRPRVDHVRAMTDRMSRTAHLPGWLVRTILPFVGPRSYAATYGPLRAPV